MEKKFDEYAYINQLVEEYQNGSEESGLELIKAFGYSENPDEANWLIGKYFNLLKYGGIKFRNKDTRRFIRLFMTDDTYKKEMIRGYQYSDTKKAARKVVQNINNRMEAFSDKEILHDLSLIILQLAHRYTKRGSRNNFCAYVISCYHFYLFRYYKHIFRDIIYSNRIEPLEDYVDENNEVDIDSIYEDDLYFENEEDQLGFNWILGKTASHPFDKLNQFERTILNLYDNEGYTYQQVADYMGYHKDTIYKRRRKIKDKLKKAIESENT